MRILLFLLFSWGPVTFAQDTAITSEIYRRLGEVSKKWTLLQIPKNETLYWDSTFQLPPAYLRLSCFPSSDHSDSTQEVVLYFYPASDVNKVFPLMFKEGMVNPDEHKDFRSQHPVFYTNEKWFILAWNPTFWFGVEVHQYFMQALGVSIPEIHVESITVEEEVQPPPPPPPPAKKKKG